MRATLNDVAAESGFSRTLVMHVIRNPEDSRYRPETRKKVLEVARRLRYRTNPLASGMVRGRTGLVSLIMPWNTLEVVDIAEAWAESVNCRLIVQFSGKNKFLQEQRALQVALDWKMDGLIWSPYEACSAFSEEIEQMRRSKMPLAVFHQDLSSMISADVVIYDFAECIRELVQHLVERKYRESIFLMPETHFSTQTIRWPLFRDEARKAGLPVTLIYQPEEKLDESELSHILSAARKPVAVFCNNDRIGVRLVSFLRESGCPVPGEVGVIAAGDAMLGPGRVGEMVYPRLTALRLPLERGTRQALSLLEKRMQSSEAASNIIRIPCQFIPREST